MSVKKILLGGVPFGRNNVGDEAILECVVKIVRQACPHAEITVSTDDPATGAKLQVNTVELFGFSPPYSRKRMKQVIREHDVFIWAGATGLSDYPEIPLEMLRIAQAYGKHTVVWGVGMNNKLNPFKYRLSGKKRQLCDALTRLCFNQINWTEMVENDWVQRTRARIRYYLSRCDLVAVRDPQSRDEVLHCGPVDPLMTGADSALLLEPENLTKMVLPGDVRAALKFSGHKIGICISAQGEITQREELVRWCNRLVEKNENRLFFIPMNPVTDASLMSTLRQQMQHPERAVVVEGRFEPSEILAVTKKMDVVISSRLHLLILASIVHVPFIGVSRGSKVDNFLAPFGLLPAGSVVECDFDQLYAETERLLEEREAFEKTCQAVRKQLITRLECAQEKLRAVLN